MTAAMASEWHKLRTVRSTWWFVLGAVAVMLLATGLESDDGNAATVASIPLAAATVNNFVQFILAALGVLAITNEFANRSITVTIACTPSRARVMLAKVAVVAGLVFAAGLAAVLVGTGVAATRFAEWAALDGSDAADLVAMGIYLSLLAVIGLGIGTVVRRTAGALTIIVLLVLVVPELMRLASERLGAGWLLSLTDYTPGPASWRFIDGEREFGLVLLAWAVAAVAAGVAALRVRDV